MTWREAQLSLQLLAEERVGNARRAAMVEQMGRQDNAVAIAKEVMAE